VRLVKIADQMDEVVSQRVVITGVWHNNPIDSAEKVFFRKSEKNISHTDALYRTIGAWLIIFFNPNFRE
jgi:hypothetical protein